MADTTPTTTLADAINASHDADNVRLIKDFAVYLLTDTTNLPTSASWTPPSSLTPVGWATDKGLTLSTKAGSETDVKGHDQSVVKSLTAAGNYTLKVPAMECRKTVAEAYFGVTISTDGAIHANAEAGPKYQVVIAGIDSDARPVIVVLRDATVTDRDDITLAGGSAIELSVTFTSHKPASGNQLDIYGLTVA